MVHDYICVCISIKTKKLTKKTGGCFEKETLVTTKSSYNEETTILWIKYTETKSSTKANMCKHRLVRNTKISTSI